MVVKKLNYYKLISFIVILCIVLFLTIFGTIKLVKTINYKRSNEYKLLTIGYSQDEADKLLKNLSNKDINKLLTAEYNKYIANLSNEKYFIFKNLDKYIEYEKDNKREDLSRIISIINTEADIEWIDDE